MVPAKIGFLEQLLDLRLPVQTCASNSQPKFVSDRPDAAIAFECLFSPLVKSPKCCGLSRKIAKGIR